MGMACATKQRAPRAAQVDYVPPPSNIMAGPVSELSPSLHGTKVCYTTTAYSALFSFLSLIPSLIHIKTFKFC